MPVRNFTWEDLPALLDFVEAVRFSGQGEVGGYCNTPLSSNGRELWRRVFQETLAYPGLAPEDNCFLFETNGQIQGFCRLCPELAIGRTLLEVDVMPPTPTSQATARGLKPEARSLREQIPPNPPLQRGEREDFSRQVERELVRRAVARSRELGTRVVHTCIPKGSPKGKLLEEEKFSPARIYWDMSWQCLSRPNPPAPFPTREGGEGARWDGGRGSDTSISGETTQGRSHQRREGATPPKGFHIRHFRPEDAQALTDAQNAAFGGSWGFCPNSVEQIRYRSSMSNTRYEGILLLCHGERIAGYCWTSLAPAIDRTKGIIDMIGVVPDYRGHGLSRPILVTAMEYLQSAGAGEIGLQVDSSNTPAIRLYNSVGFEKVRELQWFKLDLPVKRPGP